MSAIARILLAFKINVSGSDLQASSITEDLKKKGANIKIGSNKITNIPATTDIVVYTNAVKKINPELKSAIRKKIKKYSYPEFLAELMNTHLPLVVAGTHGKSTTTAMVAKIFIDAGLDPSVVLGTNAPFLGGNARLGLGRYFVVEGDEFHEAFLSYDPVGLIVNNIEKDHLDFYKTEEKLLRAFAKLIGKVPVGGVVVANAEDDRLMKISRKAKSKIITFGLEKGDYQASHITRHGELTRFAVKGPENFDLSLRVPGQHNVKNALAAAIMAMYFGIDISIIKKSLLSFQGLWRRFEIKGRSNSALIIDDYAHHPTEIKATLKAARDFFPGKRIIAIFQPHSHHRTKSLYDDFIKAFDLCDELILTDVYNVAGRELKQKVDIKKMADLISDRGLAVKYIKNFKNIPRSLKARAKADEILIFMGAGDITEAAGAMVRK